MLKQSESRRRVASSLSPAKNRPPQPIIRSNRILPAPGKNGRKSSNDHKCDQPKSARSSNSSSRKSPRNNPTFGSVAVSQEESCLVSATGDVLVCRGREFAQLFGMEGKAVDGNAVIQWCEMECGDHFPKMTLEQSALCNPWMPHTQRESPSNEISLGGGLGSDVGAMSVAASHGATMPRPGLLGGSPYEWVDPATTNGGLKGGGAEVAGTLPVANAAGHGHHHHSTTDSPFSGSETDLAELDDRVLSLPSFDYSHFGHGGNDMVPSSPSRSSSQNRLSPIFDEEPVEDENIAYRVTSTTNSPAALRPIEPGGTTNKINRMLENSPTTRVMMPVKAMQPSTRYANKNMKKKSSQAKDVLSRPPFMHGVPSFLPALSQVQITQVSAHPLGSHVLLISAEALLFSYGLNDHGQLGIGVKTSVNDFHRKFVWRPTIITPLLENGGKAITCAAGESHSLVVVMTEGKRLLKTQFRGQLSRPLQDSSNGDQRVTFEFNRVISSPSVIHTDRDKDDGDNSSSSRSPTASDSVLHHQLYGFGRNNFTKIGLVHPKRSEVNDSEDEMDDVLLPRRVALHCTVWPEKNINDESLPPRGIFALAASSEHSAALVRRATGDIELYTWGNAAYGALGLALPPSSNTTRRKNNNTENASKVVPVPTCVSTLSYSAISTATAAPKSLLDKERNEFPVGVSLGPYCSFVVTSAGRCLSFGISLDGMLGHGTSVREAFDPSEVKFSSKTRSTKVKHDDVEIRSISAGTGHVVALTKTGDVYTWGSNSDTRLGIKKSVSSLSEDDDNDHDNIQWLPKRVDMSAYHHAASKTTPDLNGTHLRPQRSQTVPKDDTDIVQVCAGCDCTFFIAKSGKVLSCGKVSGRLGLGELSSDVDSPRPLFGGLRLWTNRDINGADSSIVPLPPPPPPPPTTIPSRTSLVVKRPDFNRGFTLG